MDEMQELIKAKLEVLAGFRCRIDALTLQRQSLVDALITPEVAAQIAEVNAEFEEPLTEMAALAAATEAEIKRLADLYGQSVKGERFQVVYSKPRVTWDAKSLDGYAMAHPELFAFRREGEPSISIRTVK